MLTVFIYNSKTNALFGQQGMVQYSSTRLPPIWPGFKSWRQQHMWVEFVVGFSPVLWGVPQVVFPSPQKAIFPNSNSARNQVDKEPLCGCAISKLLFTMYLFICFIYHLSQRLAIQKSRLCSEKNWRELRAVSSTCEFQVAQCSTSIKKLRFHSSHPIAKVRCQGSLGTARSRAQPWKIHSLYTFTG